MKRGGQTLREKPPEVRAGKASAGSPAMWNSLPALCRWELAKSPRRRLAGLGQSPLCEWRISPAPAALLPKHSQKDSADCGAAAVRLDTRPVRIDCSMIRPSEEAGRRNL